jgi:hypothetical protein
LPDPGVSLQDGDLGTLTAQQNPVQFAAIDSKSNRCLKQGAHRA